MLIPTLEIIYFIIGILLAVTWWKTEYKAQYDEAKASEYGAEEGMVCWLLLMILFFWPIKLIWNWFSNNNE